MNDFVSVLGLGPLLKAHGLDGYAGDFELLYDTAVRDPRLTAVVSEPVLVPSVCAYGQLKVLPNEESLLSIRRCVMMQSYLFFIVVWAPTVSLEIRRHAVEALGRANMVTRVQAMEEIRPVKTRVQLTEPCLDVRTWLHVRALEETQRKRTSGP